MTDYILDYDEICHLEISSMFDDMRGAGEHEMDSWTQDIEPLFTLKEFLSIYDDRIDDL